MRAHLAAVLLTVAAAANAGDARDGLSGTWGLPPVDGQPGVTGSYFTLDRTASGAHAKINLNPGGWSCGADADLTWNAAATRYEWPNRSKTEAGEPCWVQASPRNDRLDLKVSCPYECTTSDAPHAITLERMAADRLVPPDWVLDMFCSTHDTLRQELCRPGELQTLVAEGNRVERQRGVLADGTEPDVPLLPETTRDLLAMLATCRTNGGGTTCLAKTLRERRDSATAAVASRQKVLAEERRKSEAAATPIADATAWTGERYLVSDTFVAALAIERCDDQHCEVSVTGETNYTFGYQEHHGDCSHGQNVLTLTAPDRGFSYVEPDDSDRDAEGAGPFANFCRIDLARSGDTIHLALRGIGCMTGCSNAQWPGLAGDYHPHPKPSFTCPENAWSEPWDEQNLCLDPELAALDRAMAAAFAKAKAGRSGAEQTALVKAQRAWIAKRRDDCNVDQRRTCLVAAYRTRLEELARP